MRNLRIYDINPNLVEAGDGVTPRRIAAHLARSPAARTDQRRLRGHRERRLEPRRLTSPSRLLASTAARLTSGAASTTSCISPTTRTSPTITTGSTTAAVVTRSSATRRRRPTSSTTTGSASATSASPRRQDAEARVESNYFENSLRPHWRQLDGNGTAGIAVDDGNVYTGASNGSTNRDVGGSVFSVPYPVHKETAAAARTAVTQCAGLNRSAERRHLGRARRGRSTDKTAALAPTKSSKSDAMSRPCGGAPSRPNPRSLASP